MNTDVMEPLVIWRLLDGKAGHESQTAGLVAALERAGVVNCHDIVVPRRRFALKDWIQGRCRFGADLPDPQLLLGAGNRTHVALLAARRARGGRAVVFMRPSLPQCWFDLCLIPAHDRPPERANVIVTQGVLNTVERATSASLEQGLILIGGPSSHYGWDATALLKQVESVVGESSGVAWTLTTSRRTPPETTAALLSLQAANLKVIPVAETPDSWVGEQLQQCALVWVSEDSVSMVYEALTAGARVGLLEVPTKGTGSRVAGGVASLVKAGALTPYAEPLPDLVGHKGAQGFNEADRCSAALLEKFFPK